MRPCAADARLAGREAAAQVAPGLGAKHHGAVAPGSELRFDEKDAHVILLALKTISLKDGATPEAEPFEIKIGGFMLLPAGTRTRWIIGQRQAEFLELDLAARNLARIADAGGYAAGVALLPLIGHHDIVIESIGRACLFEVLSPTRGTQMLLESYGIGLAVHLFRRYCERPELHGSDECAMSPFRLKRVLNFIEDNLEENLTMRDLAEAADLSLYHFTRCFKRDTGFTPYRYIIERRIAKAKELISGSQMPLAQVALASGFGSQANFTSMFHRVVGMPPGVWRKANGW